MVEDTDNKKLRPKFENIKDWIMHRRGIYNYIYFSFFMFLIGFACTMLHYSFTITVSSGLQIGGFLMLLFRIKHRKTNEGVSLHSLIIFVLTYVVKFSSNLIDPELFPELARSNYLYFGLELVGLSLALYLMVIVIDDKYSTNELAFDRIKFYFIIPGCILFAAILHPKTELPVYINIYWMLGFFLHFCAMLPQLSFITAKAAIVDDFVGHYIMFHALSSAFQFCYWLTVKSETETYKKKHKILERSDLVSQYFVFFQLLQTILYADFALRFYKSMKSGTPITGESEPEPSQFGFSFQKL